MSLQTAVEDEEQALLEICVLDVDGDDPVVIHAMALRPRSTVSSSRG